MSRPEHIFKVDAQNECHELGYGQNRNDLFNDPPSKSGDVNY